MGALEAAGVAETKWLLWFRPRLLIDRLICSLTARTPRPLCPPALPFSSPRLPLAHVTVTGTQLTKVLKDAKKGAKLGMFSMREKFKKFIGSETEIG